MSRYLQLYFKERLPASPLLKFCEVINHSREFTWQLTHNTHCMVLAIFALTLKTKQTSALKIYKFKNGSRGLYLKSIVKQEMMVFSYSGKFLLLHLRSYQFIIS